MSWQQPQGQPQQPEWGSAPQPQPQPAQFSQPQPAQFGQPQPAQFGQPQPQFGQPQPAQFGQPQPAQFGQPQPAQFGEPQPQFGAPQPGQPTPPPFYTPHPYEKKRSGFGTRQIIAVVALVVIVGGGYLLDHVNSVQRNSNGAITHSGTVSVTTLKVGDCFNGGSVGAVDLTAVTGVPCTQAHSGQVLSSVPMTDTSYPSSSALDSEAQTDCKSVWTALPSSMPSDANGAYLAPSSASDFTQGDATITCLVQSTSQDLTSSYVTGS